MGINLTLPEGFLGQIASSTSSVFSDISPVVTLVAGVLLAMLVTEWIISIIRGRKNIDENE